MREQELREQGWVVVISRVWAPRTLRNIGTEPQSTDLHLQISTDIVYRDCQNLKKTVISRKRPSSNRHKHVPSQPGGPEGAGGYAI